MKKLSYLFLALLIVACSSDDSSDDANQLFLERYDGVVWENAKQGKIAFKINDIKNIVYDDNDGCYFQPLEGSFYFSDGRPYIRYIEQETENSITYRRTYETTNGTPILERKVWTVSLDGNYLTYNGVGSYVFSRTNYEVCTE